MRLQDQALIELVREHVLGDTRLAGQCIDVICSEGNIILVGCADTDEQKHLAGELAKGVIGVRQVQNHILARCQVRNNDSDS